ncbi:MAG TPA: dihydropteroate synthase [Pararhizobium sp.]|nr:dihydropteroate synthase [Pararhizobium sp.]
MSRTCDPFEAREWRLARGRSLTLGPQAIIMAIVNVTPDSFSDGGRFSSSKAAAEAALRMAEEGVHILDIGGESTRPGGAPVSAEEEQARAIPVIEAVASRTPTLISIDTYRAETARRAIAAGAHIVNDIWGFQQDPEIAGATAAMQAGAVVMHNGRSRRKLPDMIDDQKMFLDRSLEIARAAGVPEEALVLDPGFGFAKDGENDIDLMARFAELHAFGYPLLAGMSRKRSLGLLTGREASARDVATAATSVVLRLKGAAIFRVHDVAINKDALAVADAMVARRHLAEPRPER